jgi:hypothetical protein
MLRVRSMIAKWWSPWGSGAAPAGMGTLAWAFMPLLPVKPAPPMSQVTSTVGVLALA